MSTLIIAGSPAVYKPLCPWNYPTIVTEPIVNVLETSKSQVEYDSYDATGNSSIYIAKTNLPITDRLSYECRVKQRLFEEVALMDECLECLGEFAEIIKDFNLDK